MRGGWTGRGHYSALRSSVGREGGRRRTLRVARSSNTLEVTPSTCNDHGREEAPRVGGWRVQGQAEEEKALSDGERREVCEVHKPNN